MVTQAYLTVPAIFPFTVYHLGILEPCPWLSFLRKDVFRSGIGVLSWEKFQEAGTLGSPGRHRGGGFLHQGWSPKI